MTIVCSTSCFHMCNEYLYNKVFFCLCLFSTCSIVIIIVYLCILFESFLPKTIPRHSYCIYLCCVYTLIMKRRAARWGQIIWKKVEIMHSSFVEVIFEVLSLYSHRLKYLFPTIPIFLHWCMVILIRRLAWVKFQNIFVVSTIFFPFLLCTIIFVFLLKYG